MRSIYQCEKCGKIFEGYEACYEHENRHWDVCTWGRMYERATAEFTQYSEKQEVPTVVGVELRRWDSDTQEDARAVAVYHLKEIFYSDRLTSDDERQKQEDDI